MGKLETDLRMTQDKAVRMSAELTDTRNQNETLVQRHRAELAILQTEKEKLLFNSKEEIDKISALLDATKAKLDKANGVISDLENDLETKLSKTIKEKVLVVDMGHAKPHSHMGTIIKVILPISYIEFEKN